MVHCVHAAEYYTDTVFYTAVSKNCFVRLVYAMLRYVLLHMVDSCTGANSSRVSFWPSHMDCSWYNPAVHC